MENCRFISNTLPDAEGANRNFQSEYEQLPILSTLERIVESILPLLPSVTEYVSIAKQACKQDFTLFTLDESAAIYLYTMPKSFFSRLDATLRDPNRLALRPWMSFLKLLMSAIEKLPNTKTNLWRGVDYDATLNFVNNDIYTLWGITSCSGILG